MSEDPTNEDPTNPGQPPSSADDDLIAAARLAAEARSDGLPPEPELPPLDYFPSYIIAREIHRGGQGIVYQAIHKTTKRKVAIKVMIEGALASTRERTRFEREVEILAQLDHPNIVDVLDSGTVEGRFYYVMDYISGSTLDVWISQHDLSITQVLELFGKICEAVNAAHLKGVIHRDIKPANVRVDANGEPHIVDFGLARIATGSLADDDRLMTLTGQFIGSLPWASPEQAQGIPSMIDVRTDVYSLGVTLYQMLTGRFPYQVAGNMRDVLDNILRAEPARPSTVRRRINDEVETIVLKCLSKERERRYQNAGDLARDIAHYLRGDPIEAKRDSGWYVLRKTAKRYRGVVTAAGIMLVMLVGFAIGMSVLNSQKARALDDLGAESRARLAIIEELERWLEAPDPTLGIGKDITMREVADRAAARLDAEALADQPRVEASLRTIIGRTYFNLGEWQNAEPQLRRAFELHEQVSGRDSEDTLKASHLLAVVLRNTGKLDEAHERLTAARTQAERTLGPDDERTLQILNDLAQLHKLRGEHAEAIPLFRLVLDRVKDGAEVSPERLAVVRGNLGESLAMTGKIEEADAMFAASIEAFVAAHPEPHPDTARARVRYAALLRQTGQPDAAREEYEAAFEIFDHTLDATHPDVLALRTQFGAFLYSLGDFDAALQSFTIAVEGAEATEPSGSARLAWYRYWLGTTLMSMDRAAEAKPPLEQAAAALRGGRADLERRAILELARCLEALGRTERAAELRAELEPEG